MKPPALTGSTGLTRRRFLRNALWITPLAGFADAAIVEPSWLSVRTLRRTESQPRHRFVHFTDVHYKGDPGPLRTVVARINQLKPDFACFTGDLIEHARDLPAAVEMLSELKVPLYAVPGNHDLWSHARLGMIEEVCVATGGAWQEASAIFYGQGQRPTTSDAGTKCTSRWTSFLMKHATGPMVVASSDEPLDQGDLISVIGPPDELAAVTAELGHISSVDIIGDRTDLDSNRVTLSSATFAGHRLDELGLGARFGAHVSRVRRGDVDMIPTPDFVLQLGDRLRVVAPRDQMRPLRAYLGDSERGFSDINPLGLALGLTVGIGIGMIPIPLPTGTFTLGSAAGTLLAGLVFARIGRVGPIPISMPTAAAHALSALGVLVFLAYAGTKAGLLFAEAVSSNLGWKVALLGFVVTIAAAAALLLAGRLQRTDWVQLAGQLGGAQTQPALLAFANTRSSFDTRVSLGYALVYPAAMVGKILLAQLLVLLG